MNKSQTLLSKVKGITEAALKLDVKKSDKNLYDASISPAIDDKGMAKLLKALDSEILDDLKVKKGKGSMNITTSTMKITVKTSGDKTIFKVKNIPGEREGFLPQAIDGVEKFVKRSK